MQFFAARNYSHNTVSISFSNIKDSFVLTALAPHREYHKKSQSENRSFSYFRSKMLYFIGILHNTTGKWMG